MTAKVSAGANIEIEEADRTLGAASVYEANDQKGALDPRIRQVVPGLSMMGRALTVSSAPGDNLTLHAAVAEANVGDVIIADVSNYDYVGHWGEILAVAAIARGVAGLVINGAVRDIEAMSRHGFPCFATTACMGAPAKKQYGTLNETIVIGDVVVEPGDLVCGDADGVVVVRRGNAREVLESAKEREAREVSIMERLRAGEVTLDILDLRHSIPVE
jgi:4-hydroxy-4-methyl-2-oxoglutarate aldolase